MAITPRGPRRAPQNAPTLRDAQRAVFDIRERRRGVGLEDPDLSRFPDGGDFYGVLNYVTQYRRVPAEVLKKDALSVLPILRFLAAELERRTLAAIQFARAHGVKWQDLRDPLGVKSDQGAQQWLRRLESLLADPYVAGLRSERAAIAAAREATYPSPRDPGQATVAAVLQLLRELQEHRRALPADLVDDLDAALSATNPAHTLGLVRAVVTDLVAAAGELPAPLAALVREAAELLRR